MTNVEIRTMGQKIEIKSNQTKYQLKYPMKSNYGIPEEPQEEIPNPSVDIPKTVQTKRKISEKQRTALENNRKMRLESEKNTKILQRKCNELAKLNVDLDEVLENGTVWPKCTYVKS